MKRARPPDDLNGIERPHNAKRSKPSIVRPTDLGPITAMLPELRKCLYAVMDVQSLGRLARTCRGFAKDMMTAPAGRIWLPSSWRKVLQEKKRDYNAQYTLAIKFIDNHLRPRRFFERVPNAAAHCRIDIWYDRARISFVTRGETRGMDKSMRRLDVVRRPSNDSDAITTWIDQMPPGELVAKWIDMLAARAAVRQEREKRANRARAKVPPALQQRKKELEARIKETRRDAEYLREHSLRYVVSGIRPEWPAIIEQLAAVLKSMYDAIAELDKINAEIDAIKKQQ